MPHSLVCICRTNHFYADIQKQQTQARSCLVNLAAGYWHETYNAGNIWFDKFDGTSFNLVTVLCATAPFTSTWYSGAAMHTAGVSVCKCVRVRFKEKCLFLYGTGTPQLLLCLSGNVDQMDERGFRILSIRRSRRLWRIFYLLSYNRTDCALQCSIICLYFLCPVGITSDSAFSTHPPLRRQALLKGFFWPEMILQLR